MHGRQKSAPPVTSVQILAFPDARDQHDKRRQVAIVTAQSVGKPRSHDRPARLCITGLHEGDRRIMIDRFGLHRANDRNIVRHFCRPRQKLRDLDSRLSVARKGVTAAHTQQRLPLQLGDSFVFHQARGHRLAIPFVQLRLWIE